MDSCLPPDWNTTDVDAAELPLHCQRRPLGLDNELVELLWQNGEVVLQSQNHKKPNLGDSNNKFKHTSRDPNQNTNQEDETISWIQCPIAEAFEKEFCSKFLSDIPSSNPVQAQNSFNFGPSNANPVLPSSRQPDFGLNSLPPPRFSSFDGPRHENRNMGEIAEIVDPLKKQRSMGQCSAVTMGSSHCGSNQVANDLDMSRASSCGIGGNNNPWRDGTEKEMLDQPIASSSGGSGSSSLWKTSNQSNDSSRHKRKSMEESECRSDGTESESAPGNKSFHKSGTARRSRVAEVHNLSERRRRDRINEKMKALQELIPNSNKSDKASVLDEAIEYMKSLQLQLQFMWMGRGMAPMILPGVQHYMSRLGFGIGPPAIPQIQDLMRLSRFPPMVNQVMRPVTTAPTATQGMVGQTHMLNPVNYQNQMQNPCFPEQYANYMGFNSTQNTSQPMNMFNFGSHSGNNHSSARPNNGNGFIG